MASHIFCLFLLIIILPESPCGLTEAQGTLPKAELKLHPEVILIEQSVSLTCRRPDSSLAAQCTFIIYKKEKLSGSDCERSVTGAELLSGRDSALNEITMRCYYRRGGGGKPFLPSGPSTVTVLDLRKPNISVSTEYRETRIHCEAPPDITGAYFRLYELKKDPIRGIQAKEGERGVIFTFPRSTDSTLTYCCSYQFKSIESKRSDCVRGKYKDQSEETEDQNKLPKPQIRLYPAINPIKELVELWCRIPISSPAAQCTFTINEKEQLSGSDCERSVTGAELLSGRHSALNEITIRCSYSLEGGGKTSLYSDPSTVTVLDLKKPDISVSIEHSETHIHCKAPTGITGAVFLLFPKWSRVHMNSAQALKEERDVIFTVPHSADFPLTYCCQYQFQRINSELSDCVEAKNEDQSGATTNPNLKKPNISVSAEHRETHIYCEAPPGITGAYFLLYNKLNKGIIRGSQVKEGERGVIFTFSRSSDSILTYCCIDKFKSIESKLIDCVRGEKKAQGEKTEDQKPGRFLWRHILSALVLLAAIGFLIEHFITHPPTTATPGRKRRGRENTGQFVETVC